jgi:hypothetical protein
MEKVVAILNNKNEYFENLDIHMAYKPGSKSASSYIPIALSDSTKNDI